jgi:excisionase family DNA binding protein
VYPEKLAMETEDDILTKEQLAELVHVSKRTIERWVVEARVPYIKLPRRGTKGNIRFLKSTILQWLKKNEQKVTNKLLREEIYDEE